MKVLQINSICGIGSTGRITTDIAAKLMEKNIENYIAYGRETATKNDHTIKIGSKIDYYIHGALTRLFDTHALMGSARATKHLIEQIRDINPDVIHLHNIHGYYLNIKILFDYLKKSGKPVVWTFHDCWSFTGHCAHFSFAKCNQWMVGCHKCPQRTNYPASLILDNSQGNYLAKKRLFTGLRNMTIVTPSKWLADLVGRSFLSEYPVKVINNGIDTDIFKPTAGNSVREKYKLGQKFIILGVAGLWDTRKGLNYYNDLAKIIDDNCKIVLVGLDEKQLAQLPGNIMGIKKTSSIKELAQIYSAADVFVNLTLEDNFPTVNLEALACGIPVITFATGGSPEAIDNSCGFVVEQGKINDVAKLIETVRQKGKEHYSKNCIRRAIDNFNKNDRIDDYIELYEHLVKVGGRNV